MQLHTQRGAVQNLLQSCIQQCCKGSEVCVRLNFLIQEAQQFIKLLFSVSSVNLTQSISFRKRAPYIAYLTRCRQGLQTTQAHLERLLQRVLRDKEVANRYFTTVCVRLLLESKEKKIREFIQGKINADCGLFLLLHSLLTCQLGLMFQSTTSNVRSRLLQQSSFQLKCTYYCDLMLCCQLFAVFISQEKERNLTLPVLKGYTKSYYLAFAPSVNTVNYFRSTYKFRNDKLSSSIQSSAQMLWLYLGTCGKYMQYFESHVPKIQECHSIKKDNSQNSFFFLIISVLCMHKPDEVKM